MKKIIPLMVAVLLVVGTVRAMGRVVTEEVTSKISAVTVYSDRALVTRAAHLNLQPGTYKLYFKGLAQGILTDSVYATGKGNARAKILGIDIERNFLEKPRQEKTKQLTDQIQGLKDEDRVLQDAIAVLASQDEFLKSIRVQMPEDISKNMLIQKPKITDWQAILKFLDTNLRKNAQGRLNAQIKRRQLAAKIAALEKELNTLRRREVLEDKSVVVTAELNRAGELDLELSYVIRGARWYPLYDVRGQMASRQAELTYYGVISQKTGEDWKDVTLTLSTARPALGARRPEPTPWYLIIYTLPKMQKMRMEKAGSGFLALDAKEERVYEGNLHAKKVEHFVTNVEERGVSVVFNVKKKESILSDNTPHKTTIAVKELPFSGLEYSSVPRLSSYAYLKAVVTNDTDYPFLAGKVNVFSGTDYIGTSRIDTVAPQEACDLFLGIDEGIKVKRELVSKKTTSSGRKESKTIYAYRIEIENYKKEKETITVIDQIPVSQDDRIKVKLLAMSEEPAEEIEQGIIKWKFDLLPKGKKVITFSFSVEYPQGAIVRGL
jgi:uncharacterized protein (TIGR02231 family)